MESRDYFIPRPYIDSFSLQTQVLAIVLGNLVTILIGFVAYFNIVLFGHYGLELIYAVLLSEALFSVRKRMLAWLKSYTSEIWSPRAFVFRIISSTRGLFSLGLFTFFISLFFSSFHEPFLLVCIYLFTLLVLDENALVIFKCHHLFISDETLVSVVLVFVLVTGLAVFVGSFLVLAVSDMAVVIDASAAYLQENVLKDPILRERFNELFIIGKSHIDAFAKGLREQYEGTAWSPAIQLTTNVLANLTRRFENEAFSFSLSLADWEFFRDEVVSLGLSAFSSGNLSLGDTMFQAVDKIYLGLVIMTGIVFAFLDFGVRATFFAGVLLFLVSTPKSVLQTIMESLLSVFISTSKRANSMSYESTDMIEESPLNSYEDELRAQAFKHFEDDLRSTFTAVFAVPVSLATSNAVVTLFIFNVLNLLGANLVGSYFAGLLSLLFTLIPIVSPFFVCIPWCIVSSLVHRKHWASIGLFLSFYFSFSFIDTYLLTSFFHDHHEHRNENQIHQNQRKRVPQRHRSATTDQFRSYLTGLSFFFGITSLGIHGIVLGPLFVSFFYTMVSTILAQYRDVFYQFHRRETLVS